jgi:hypothetical protein
VAEGGNRSPAAPHLPFLLAAFAVEALCVLGEGISGCWSSSCGLPLIFSIKTITASLPMRFGAAQPSGCATRRRTRCCGPRSAICF